LLEVLVFHYPKTWLGCFLEFLLSGTVMVRQLQPWYENIGKRQVKSPEIYLTDSGILQALLNTIDSHSLFGHPRVGASWEGFALRHLWVIYPGQHSWPVDEQIFVWPLQLTSKLQPIQSSP
jgi:predicted AAA+ superfamily ATPase